MTLTLKNVEKKTLFAFEKFLTNDKSALSALLLEIAETQKYNEFYSQSLKSEVDIQWNKNTAIYVLENQVKVPIPEDIVQYPTEWFLVLKNHLLKYNNEQPLRGQALNYLDTHIEKCGLLLSMLPIDYDEAQVIHISNNIFDDPFYSNNEQNIKRLHLGAYEQLVFNLTCMNTFEDKEDYLGNALQAYYGSYQIKKSKSKDMIFNRYPKKQDNFETFLNKKINFFKNSSENEKQFLKRFQDKSILMKAINAVFGFGDKKYADKFYHELENIFIEYFYHELENKLQTNQHSYKKVKI